MSSGLPTRSDTNRAVQESKVAIARGLKFQISEVEGLYSLSSLWPSSVAVQFVLGRYFFWPTQGLVELEPGEFNYLCIENKGADQLCGYRAGQLICAFVLHVQN